MRSLMGEGDTCPYLLLRVCPYAAMSASLPSHCRTLHADSPTLLRWYARTEPLTAWRGQVRRGRYLVHDTLLQVQHAAARKALKRPLKVAFLGEEGVDEGGVQKVHARVCRGCPCCLRLFLDFRQACMAAISSKFASHLVRDFKCWFCFKSMRTLHH